MNTSSKPKQICADSPEALHALDSRDSSLACRVEQSVHEYMQTMGDHCAQGDLYTLMISQVEQIMFKVVLDHVEGNLSQAASILGINRATLRKKIKQYRVRDGS